MQFESNEFHLTLDTVADFQKKYASYTLMKHFINILIRFHVCNFYILFTAYAFWMGSGLLYHMD